MLFPIISRYYFNHREVSGFFCSAARVTEPRALSFLKNRKPGRRSQKFCCAAKKLFFRETSWLFLSRAVTPPTASPKQK
jgi:hypothetical protein